MMTEEEFLIQLHDAEELFQEHGIEIKSCDYILGYGIVNLTLVDNSMITMDCWDVDMWEMYNFGTLSIGKCTLQELITIYKSRQ